MRGTPVLRPAPGDAARARPLPVDAAPADAARRGGPTT
jgi:hypothetical protein